MRQENNFEEFDQSNHNTNYLKSSKTLAFWSFLIGTLILITFYFSKSTDFILLGIIYVCLAALLNGGLLVKLIFNWFSNKEYRFEVFKSILILLCNIPIVIIYIATSFWILGNLSNE